MEYLVARVLSGEARDLRPGDIPLRKATQQPVAKGQLHSTTAASRLGVA